MRILHIASISDNPFNGVCVAVPQHVIHQNEFAKTALINITNETIACMPMQLKYDKRASLEAAYEPFGRPDIIVFHEAYRVPYLKLSSQARKLGIPYVIVPHGELGEWAQKKKRLKKALGNILLFNRFIEGSTAIQCLSNSELEGTNFRCEKFIGTNGVSLPNVQKKAFSDGGISFIYIGRLDAYHKGLDIMIGAFAAEAKLMRETGSHLDIYGPDLKGRYAHVENLIAESGAADFISLHHEITGDEKVNALLVADIFVQTSRFEGMPLGVLEALGLGLPCVVTDGTCLADEITEYGAGWGCRNSRESVSQALRDILASRDTIESKGSNARLMVKENYDWSVCSKKAVSAYESLLCGVAISKKAR